MLDSQEKVLMPVGRAALDGDRGGTGVPQSHSHECVELVCTTQTHHSHSQTVNINRLYITGVYTL